MAQALVGQIISWLVLGGIITLAVAISLIRVHVVAPVLKMVRHVKTVQDTGDYSLRLDPPETDELGELGRHIDRLTAQLSSSLAEIARSHQLREEDLRQRKELEYKLQTANEKLRYAASCDGLTGFANRRLFDEHFQAEWRRMQRHGRHLSLIFLDIDHFRQYNEIHGPSKGDECLMDISRCLRLLFKRAEDLVARYSGGKFAILLSECPPETANKLGEDAIAAVARLYIEYDPAAGAGMVTCSGGVCTTIPDGAHHPEDLLKQAMANLGKAKATGGNQSWFTVMDEVSLSAGSAVERSALSDQQGNQQRQ